MSPESQGSCPPPQEWHRNDGLTGCCACLFRNQASPSSGKRPASLLRARTGLTAGMHFERGGEPLELALIVDEAMAEMLRHVIGVVEPVQILPARGDERRRVFPLLLRGINVDRRLRHHLGQ